MPPADLAARPAKWLGECPRGAAEGLGVLRLGSGEPHEFFMGRMRGGRPVMGFVMQASGEFMAAMAFDARGNGIVADGEHIPEQDRVWATAARAARATADWFARQGNRASAAYYRRWEWKITHGRPE